MLGTDASTWPAIVPAATAGVMIRPGATALARMSSLPQRDATCRASAVIPLFAIAYDGRTGSPMNAAADAVYTIAPPPRSLR